MIVKVDNYVDSENRTLQLQTCTSITDGSVKYFTPLPVLTEDGIITGLFEITNVTSIAEAFTKIPDIQSEYEKKITEQINRAKLLAPPSPSVSNQLKLTQ